MPIYMDRHDVPGEVTSEQVVQIHQADLKIQHKYNCRAITYWFDARRKKAFCLIEAPNEESMLKMHKHSHGQVPNKVVEVDENMLELFYGKIENPDDIHAKDLHNHNDSPVRTIMVMGLKRSSLDISLSEAFNKSMQNYSKSIVEIIKRFEGSIIQQNSANFLVSFESASKAVSCALNIQSGYDALKAKPATSEIQLKIGINTGVPVTDKEKLFESTIKLAERMCEMVKEQIVMSFEVKKLYKSENINVLFDTKLIHVLAPSDEEFLTLLMDYIEEAWSNSELRVNDFGRQLGYSKSQLYRKLISLTGRSPNALIKEYRLSRALTLFSEQKENISEVAFGTGFNSPAYFSKCFFETYGILPSDYLKQSLVEA